ncbi:uncharacterized protein DKFZp434B061-like [Ruditapes philippinarum]|uniref:uncharacterized protein DKFZp434B061-like n=1 Tax=Ruditapes philippinarum TaxID=129788 RepID=UPI00295B618B|nr:uncharacterized protein DKFZp434B061-like [Ruditapes philippinarum]
MDFSIPPRDSPTSEIPGDSSDSSSSLSFSEGERPPPAKRPAKRPVNTQRIIEDWVIHLELDLGGICQDVQHPPCVTNTPSHVSLSGRAASPCVTNTPSRVSLSGRAASPCVTNTPSCVSLSGHAASPCVTNTPSRVSLSGRAASPCVTNTPSRVSLSGRAASPSVTNSQSRASLSGRAASPCVTNTPSRVSLSGRAASPCVTTTPTHPELTAQVVNDDDNTVVLSDNSSETQARAPPVLTPHIGGFGSNAEVDTQPNSDTTSIRSVIPKSLPGRAALPIFFRPQHASMPTNEMENMSCEPSNTKVTNWLDSCEDTFSVFSKEESRTYSSGKKVRQRRIWTSEAESCFGHDWRYQIDLAKHLNKKPSKVAISLKLESISAVRERWRSLTVENIKDKIWVIARGEMKL